MAHALPSVESLIAPCFFEGTAIGLRLLQRALDLHLINRVTEDMLLPVEIPHAYRGYSRILEHIWFLLFMVAAASKT